MARDTHIERELKDVISDARRCPECLQYNFGSGNCCELCGTLLVNSTEALKSLGPILKKAMPNFPWQEENKSGKPGS